MNASSGNNPKENNSNPSRSNEQQKGKGRQKMRMEMIENETNLHVTFSKRRDGLFKKANELNTLCGAESALVVFSPGGKPYSYGHPSVETIANRLLNTSIEPTPQANPLLATHSEESIRQLNQELDHKQRIIEHERRRRKELESLFLPRINKMNLNELDKLKASVLEFKFAFESQLSSLGSSPDVQGLNPEQGCSNVVSINQGGLNMPNYPNAHDPTHWASSSTSFQPAPLDQNMGYNIQYPYGVGGSNVLIPYNVGTPNDEALLGATTTTEVEDEKQVNVSNKPRGRGTRRKNGRGGRS